GRLGEGQAQRVQAQGQRRHVEAAVVHHLRAPVAVRGDQRVLLGGAGQRGGGPGQFGQGVGDVAVHRRIGPEAERGVVLGRGPAVRAEQGAHPLGDGGRPAGGADRPGRGGEGLRVAVGGGHREGGGHRGGAQQRFHFGDRE